MLILVINCGSSSAKYQLFNIARRCSLALRHCPASTSSAFALSLSKGSVPMVSKVEPLAKGIVERIGQSGSTLKHQSGKNTLNRKVSCKDHKAAIKIIVKTLTHEEHGAIDSKDEIYGIGHRVVHGGEEFEESTLITEKVIKSIEKYVELAPLHNPPALLGIRSCRDILKGIPQVAVFDTSFHQTMPAKAFLYGLPFKYYKKYAIRRYGFHGTSHRFVAEETAKILKSALNRLKIITCHLGNGCSMAAVDRGRSVDTTMGFTPLEGLLMGTRSGDLDPAAVFYLMDKENLSPEEISDILNKKSGLLGISGFSNDMRDLLKRSKADGETARRSRIAIEAFIYRIEKYIGAYQAAMGGLDAIIFTAGIGENCPWLVKKIEKDLKGIVSKNTKFLVIPTNEELLIAKDTYKVIESAKRKAQGVKLKCKV